MRNYLYRKLFMPLNNFYCVHVFPRCAEAYLDAAFVRVREKMAVRSDVSDHLSRLYSEAMLIRPKLIVELGTRGGESTLALLVAAQRSEAVLVSVDAE